MIGTRTRAAVVLSVVLSALLTSSPGLAQTSAKARRNSSATTPTPYYSLNWSGWGLQTGPGAVTAVSATWTIPTVTSSTETSVADFWIGIDGVSDRTVEQTGIAANPDKAPTAVSGYSVWSELYPAPTVVAPFSAAPGDTVKASVTYSSSTDMFTTTVTVFTPDGTAVGTLTNTQASSAAQRSSAEWIVERGPCSDGAYSCAGVSLADFGTLTFDNASATVGNATGSFGDLSSAAGVAPFATTLVSNGTFFSPVKIPSATILAAPGTESQDGASLPVVWEHS